MTLTKEGEGKRVLVTGAAGLIGRHVCRALVARGHQVRGFDQASAPELSDHHQGDLTDPDAVRRAMEGMEVVIHLGATPSDDDFMAKLLPNNIVGVYSVFEAARDLGIERVVAASSVQTVDAHVRHKRIPVRVEEGPAPTNHYAVTKVFAEQMGLMYVLQHGMSVLMVRPGWVPRDPPGDNAENVDIYLSHEDAGRFFTAAVESEKPGRPGFGIAFAISRSRGAPTYDLSSARELIGYEPRDLWPEGLHF